MTLLSFSLTSELRIDFHDLDDSDVQRVSGLLGAPLDSLEGTRQAAELVVTDQELTRADGLKVLTLDRCAALAPLGGVSKAGSAYLVVDQNQSNLIALVAKSDLTVALASIIPFAALVADGLVAHGAAFSLPNQTGILLLGQAHSGKTGAMLGAVDAGGTFIADDLVFLDKSTGAAFASPAMVSIAFDYVADFHWLAKQVPVQALASARRRHHMESTCRTILPPWLAARLLPSRLARRWISGTHSRIRFSTPPQTLSRLGRADAPGSGSVPIQHLISIVIDPDRPPGWSASDASSFVTRWRLSLEPEVTVIRRTIDEYQYQNPGVNCVNVDQLLEQAGQRLLEVAQDKLISTVVLPEAQPAPELLYGLVEDIVDASTKMNPGRTDD